MLIFLISLEGCHHSGKKTTNIPLTVEIQENNTGFTQDIFEPPLIVIPQTTDQSLLGRIEKMILNDSVIFMKDTQRQTIWAFDTLGRYMFNIAPQGRGPGEYVSLTDFTVNRQDKELIVYASTPGKLLFYDFSGKFKSEIPLTGYYDEITYYAGKLVCITARMTDYDHYIHTYRITDGQLTEESKTDLPYQCKNSFYAYGAQLQCSKHLHFTRRNDPTIYRYTPNGPQVLFRINFGKHSLPAQLSDKEISDTEYSTLMRNYITSIINLKEMSGKYFFTTNYPGIFLITEAPLQIKYIHHFKDKELGIFQNALIPLEETSNNRLAFQKKVSDLKVETSFPGKRPGWFTEKVNQMNEDDNPVLFFYRVKPE